MVTKFEIEESCNSYHGPSEYGKTTFICCLNRMHEIISSAKVSGKVLFNGINIYDNGIDPVLIRRKIGMVFQKPNPSSMMSIYDNVIASLKLNGFRDGKTFDIIVKRSLELAFQVVNNKDFA